MCERVCCKRRAAEKAATAAAKQTKINVHIMNDTKEGRKSDRTQQRRRKKKKAQAERRDYCILAAM